MSTPNAAPSSSSPRVLMMVGNDIRHDTRVLKSALALADGGASVTVLGLSPTGRREQTTYGPVQIVRVPVAWRLRDQRQRAMKSRLERSVVIGTAPAEKRLVDLRANVRAREFAELGGRRRQIAAKAASAQREVTRIRNGLDRRLGRVETRARNALARRLGTRVEGASWRRNLPEVTDYDLAFAPVVDTSEWDVLHAHDVHHVGTAAHAVARRRKRGRPGDASVSWVYDAHEFVAGLPIYPPRTKRLIAAWEDLEAEYVHDAAAVITVTAPLAAELASRYALETEPTVVMNAPVFSEELASVPVTVRDACGLADGVPLVVYSGGVTRARGVQTVVAALEQLPDVHLAVVCVPHNKTGPVELLRKDAQARGVADRLHLLDPVAPQAVSAFLASADLGVHPMVHFGSHEFALPNKLFEYLRAGLPLAVSDCRALAEFVSGNDVGEVFVAEDAASCAEAIRRVLDRESALRKRIADDPGLLEPYSWNHQAARLRELYSRLLAGRDALAPLTEPARETSLSAVEERPADRSDRAPVVGIGPANMAGQAWAWGKALERHVPGTTARVLVVDRNLPILFPADEIVPVATYTSDARWAQGFEAAAVERWTHALFEAGRPLFGLRHGKTFVGDVEVLRSVGVRTGLLFHGSEVRDPRLHATSTPWSPFRDPQDDLTCRLQTQRDTLWPQIADYLTRDLGPVFVSTPDLLPHVPGARLLPVVVDVEAWACERGVLERAVPVVVHAPSSSALKGTALVDDTLRSLAAEGVVDYRRVEDVPPAQMPDIVKDADLVLDQFSLGIYGVAACEAMAAGRLVVSHVSDDTRSRCPEELPVLEATADTLENVLRGLLADRDGARALAARGHDYVHRHHDGRESAAVLAEALGLRRD